MPQPIEMTRQQLYELVWSKPMGEVAASLPMSQPSLKKLCLKHQVPLPPLGYWKKSEIQLASKTPLSVLAMGDERIWVKRFLQRKSVPPSLTGQVAAANQDRARWHECTRRTKSTLAQADPDRRGALISTGYGVASINVAPETVDRALAVLDDLIRAVERLGHSISVKTSPAKLFINGTLVPVTISERFVRSDEPADAAEFKRRGVYERKYPKYFRLKDIEAGWTHRPSGKLTILLSNGSLHGLPSRWSDVVSYRVESRVDDVATAAVAHAQAINLRNERIQQRLAERRVSEDQRRQAEQESDQQSKRDAFSDELADMLEDAARLARSIRKLANRV